ncbi:protein stunted-like isoform X2 [Vespa mandarinia]|uniref:protein stunted-like isoform X2 n=2 Tax=Vespa TaxID=7443 RepID=UPI00161D5E51|nr:protein stunted-like isoform X2 [Vespa mandarinia]
MVLRMYEILFRLQCFILRFTLCLCSRHKLVLSPFYWFNNKIAEMSAWRQAGLNYINYSQIAARLVRQALKSDVRTEAQKRDESSVKFTQWKDGKPIKKQ